MKIIFRADGNSTIGLGHIMRLSALMQIMEMHFDSSFYTRDPDHFPDKDFQEQPELYSLTNEITLEEEAAHLAKELEKDAVVVLDGYQFTTAYQQILKNAGLRIVCIDDIFAYHFVADIIINHAGGLKAENYSCESYTKLFLGPQYALVKPLFFQNRNSEVTIDDHKLLIALGGADSGNDTDKVLEAVNKLDFEEVHVLLGGPNKNASALKEKYKQSSTVTFHQSLTASEVCALMSDCSQAVLAPSTVCYEYMTVGGAVFLYQIADNQENIKRFFLQEQLAFSFDGIGKVNETQMSDQIIKQKKVFDGKSSQRLLQIFSELAN